MKIGLSWGSNDLIGRCLHIVLNIVVEGKKV